MAFPATRPATPQDKHARDRAIMVTHHLEARGIFDPLVLAAMGEVPREAFVAEPLKEFAYEDSVLPIEAGQTISQPYIAARMIELLELESGDKVLEVGAGSGYAAAVMGRIAGKVYAIERHKELAELARRRLKALGYSNVEIICADGTKGLPEQAPFDAILVFAGGPRVPEALKQQLAVGGRLVIPVGLDVHQTLLLVRRIDNDEFEQEDYGAVTFVPLIGAEGWVETEQAKATKIDAEISGFADGLLVPSQRARVIRSKISSLIAEVAEPFGDADELAAPTERFAGKRVVLLGEATHGTAEFYDARAAITEKLVAKHGFNIVAVEAAGPTPESTMPMCAGCRARKCRREPSLAFPPGCGATTRSPSPSTGSRPSIAGSVLPRRSAASMASTSIALAPRSRRCSPISMRSIPRPGAWRASAMAASHRGAPSPSATGACLSRAAMQFARGR
jgi:protein-L-isoaspartate(D-aspartate) O-methyltransferase